MQAQKQNLFPIESPVEHKYVSSFDYIHCYSIIWPTGKHYNPSTSTTLLNNERYS